MREIWRGELKVMLLLKQPHCSVTIKDPPRCPQPAAPVSRRKTAAAPRAGSATTRCPGTGDSPGVPTCVARVSVPCQPRAFTSAPPGRG